jgi:uncharacterized membrane protein YjgN (DUF898 family)
MNESKFTGGLLGMIGTYILMVLISVFTLGIALPWALCIWQKWVADHTIIDGKQMVFDGTGAQLFGNYIKWWLLCMVTLGIYSLWLPIKFRQWTTMHTHVR